MPIVASMSTLLYGSRSGASDDNAYITVNTTPGGTTYINPSKTQIYGSSVFNNNISVIIPDGLSYKYFTTNTQLGHYTIYELSTSAS